MKTEKFPEQSEVVRSLASTIRKKVVAPPADRADLINREIQQINEKLGDLERKLSQLDSFSRLTRSLAVSLAAAAALLSIVLFYVAS